MTRKLAGLIVVIVAGAVLAQPVGDFDARLQSLSEQLTRREFDRTKSGSGALAERLLSEIPSGSEFQRDLATLAAVRACAEAGLGHSDDAGWYSQMAATLNPQANQAGPTFIAACSHANEPRRMEPLRRLGYPGPKIDPPRLKVRAEPRYPPAARLARIQKDVVIEIVIDESGIPREPRVLGQGWEPALAYAAMVAVQEWRFEPARSEGKVIPLILNLRVKFKLE
jgi:TonB family protein